LCSGRQDSKFVASDRQDDVEQFGRHEELPPVMNATASAIMQVVIAASASEISQANHPSAKAETAVAATLAMNALSRVRAARRLRSRSSFAS
jgi:hypothetical protein